MLKQNQRSIEFENVLSRSLPCAPSFQKAVEQEIRETSDFLAEHLNPELQLTRGAVLDHNRIYLEWKGNQRGGPRGLGHFMEQVFEFQVRSYGYPQNVKRDLIFDFLANLRGKVDKYRGQPNPAKPWRLLMDRDGYIIIDSNEELADKLPPDRTIILPAELSLEDTLAYAQKKFRSPKKLIAVYQHFEPRFKELPSEWLTGFIFSEKNSDARKELVALFERMTPPTPRPVARRI